MGDIYVWLQSRYATLSLRPRFHACNATREERFRHLVSEVSPLAIGMTTLELKHMRPPIKIPSGVITSLSLQFNFL
jgi:hypothetical protein